LTSAPRTEGLLRELAPQALGTVRGHLLELAGDTVGARECYRRAARMTTSIAERQYLALRAAALA
jgi:predicted RNA polymerase sigma factor